MNNYQKLKDYFTYLNNIQTLTSKVTFSLIIYKLIPRYVSVKTTAKANINTDFQYYFVRKSCATNDFTYPSKL